jgi:hypothetical protein
MAQTEAEIVNKLGLHARAAARLTEVAGASRPSVVAQRPPRTPRASWVMMPPPARQPRFIEADGDAGARRCDVADRRALWGRGIT